MQLVSTTQCITLNKIARDTPEIKQFPLKRVELVTLKAVVAIFVVIFFNLKNKTKFVAGIKTTITTITTITSTTTERRHVTYQLPLPDK